MNTFLLKETTNSRSVEVSFSDTAIVNLGDVLSYTANNRIGKGKNAATPGEVTSQLFLPGTSIDPDEGEKADGALSEKTVTPKQMAGVIDRERMRDVFAQDGERLVLDNLRLKASGQLDAGRRLVYLFLYAHELEGRQQSSRESMNEVLKDVGLYDPNISNWISTTSDLRESTEGNQSLFRLRKTGRDEAKKVLAEVLDDNFADPWTLSERSRTKPKSNVESSANEKGGSNKGKKKTSEADEWANKWNALNLGVDGHSIVEAATSLDKGLFGLWAIRRATTDGIKVVGKYQLASFLHRAFVVKAAASTLAHALESKNAKGKVLRVPGGYEITPTGINDAMALAGLGKSNLAAAAKGSK